MSKAREGQYLIIRVINAVIKYLITGYNRVINSFIRCTINCAKSQVEIFKQKHKALYQS